jgi:hypothetical protein
MTLQWIAIILGMLMLAGGLAGVLRPQWVRRFIEQFPRSTKPAWFFTALCCWLGAKEALGMNMGFLDGSGVKTKPVSGTFLTKIMLQMATFGLPMP